MLLGAIAYHAFVVLLMLSPPDRLASFLFLANTPVFALWLFRLARRNAAGVTLGLLGILVQLGIAIILLFVLDGADVTAVMSINGGIALCIAALTFTCWLTFRPTNAAGNAIASEEFTAEAR